MATFKNKNDSIDQNITAQPHDKSPAERQVQGEESLEATPVDFGEMNEADARESGYTDEKGQAVSLAKKDKKGHPTGAYTDIGAGRSGAVVLNGENH